LGPRTKSSVNDIVTVMDQQSERSYVATYWTHGPMTRSSERRSGASEGPPHHVVIDPIDGTVNYLYEIPPTASRWPPSSATRGRRTVATGRRRDLQPVTAETFHPEPVVAHTSWGR
jgi:hypothetical protein